MFVCLIHGADPFSIAARQSDAQPGKVEQSGFESSLVKFSPVIRPLAGNFGAIILHNAYGLPSDFKLSPPASLSVDELFGLVAMETKNDQPWALPRDWLGCQGAVSAVDFWRGW